MSVLRVRQATIGLTTNKLSSSTTFVDQPLADGNPGVAEHP